MFSDIPVAVSDSGVSLREAAGPIPRVDGTSAENENNGYSLCFPLVLRLDGFLVMPHIILL